jgi:O-antigen/teichoic acid export membrane protein
MRIIVRFIILIALILAWAAPPTTVIAAADPPTIYYSGPEGAVKTALDLTRLPYTQDISTAGVIVLNGTIPDAEAAAAQMRAGAGVLLILGAEVTAEQAGTLLGAPVMLSPHTDAVTLIESGTGSRLGNILWNTAPQLRERIQLSTPGGGKPAGLEPAVLSLESGEALIASAAVGQGRLLLLSALLGEENQQFRQWGYFNYLVYSLVSRAAGREPLSFADYPASPVPHPGERLFLYLSMAALLASSGGIFWLVRRYSLAHPEALDTLVRDRQAFAAREAGTDWEQIGFHRPLGGFMFALMTGIFLFIPLTVYQDFILPVYILPSAQAMGIYGRVASFFPIIWGLFDMGTSVAHMKFFSEYRVRNPRRAIQYAQFFVWWQALTGAVQVAMVVAVAGTLMPQSAYALYTWAVITHAFIQIPGFFRLFTDAFSGIQRSDYGTILDMGINMIFPMVAQPIVVSLLVWWGWNNPVFGPSMGGVVGLGVAAYATELMSFAFGWYLYRRLGYNSRLLMMAHFDKVVALDSLKYGLFLFLSSLIGGLGTSINVLVIQNRLHNNNEILGNLGLAGSFVFAFSVFQSLTGAMMPSISEAVSNGRKILAQYYATNGYKYGGMVSGYIGAIMLAVADRFILGSSGQSFERAAVYVVPMLLSGAMSFASWNADAILYGAGKTRIITVLTLVDLVLGISLGLLLVDRFQVYGLLAVPFITVPMRILLGYALNHRYCFPQRFYFWQSVGAPLLAGGAHFAVVRLVSGWIWQQDELSSILILVFALIPSYPLYAFLYGFFGGWDTNTLAVFDRATQLASFMRPFTRFFFHASALGARISPLHNRFPISIHQAAMSEAKSLTAERVSLLQPAIPGD